MRGDRPTQTLFAPQDSSLVPQFAQLVGIKLPCRRGLTELERSKIGDNCPAVLRRYAIAVTVHRTVTIGNHIEDMSNRGDTQPIQMPAWRRNESPLNDNAAAIPRFSVAHYAINREFLLPAIESRCQFRP